MLHHLFSCLSGVLRWFGQGHPVGGFRPFYMARSIGTGFDALARILGQHPETAFIRAFVRFPSVELGSETVLARPLSANHDFI
ncbi:hypothetical protein PAE2_34 [Pseudomonas phage PAE2]|nr:hypothetical protein PAE2_34 [Pseudomonas phage PAE2]